MFDCKKKLLARNIFYQNNPGGNIFKQSYTKYKTLLKITILFHHVSPKKYINKKIIPEHQDLKITPGNFGVLYGMHLK